MLSGGPSPESHASRISAAGVHAALVACAYEVVWLDLSQAEEWEVRSVPPSLSSVFAGGACPRSGSWQDVFASLMQRAGVELVFPVIHGPVGEDGQVQKLCEFLSLACVGCSSEASIACYDKALFKRIARSAGLPVARFRTVELKQYEDNPADIGGTVERELGYPCIVKPSRSGSSLGLSRVEGRNDLDKAISLAFAFDEVVLIEQLFAGCDVEIGVMEDGAPLVGSPVEIEYHGGLYDFEIKYAGNRDHRYLPARLSDLCLARLMQAAASAFQVTGCGGMARVDLLVDPGGERFVLNEINTIPYMPESSTFATSLCHATRQTYGDLVTRLVQIAWSTHIISGDLCGSRQVR